MALTGRCKCGPNVFHVEDDLPEKLTSCTCSFYSKLGHHYAYFAPDQFKPVQADSDAIYRWNSKTAAKHFCGTCGWDLYADRPDFQRDGSWDGETRRIAVNARLLDVFGAADWPVAVIDGKHLW